MIERHEEPTGLRLSEGTASLLLVPKLGLSLPRYHFHLGRVVHAAGELGLFRVLNTLLLGNDLTGHAELSEMQGDPAGLARLIAAAQAEMQARPEAFGETLVAELPGWRDAAGVSPFWQALGGRLFNGDPHDAERRLGPAWRSHLAALLPRQTLYLALLDAAAEQHLSEADASANELLAALRDAGFQAASHVRIDDGGPVLSWRPR